MFLNELLLCGKLNYGGQTPLFSFLSNVIIWIFIISKDNI
jgi:hypothetical protein